MKGLSGLAYLENTAVSMPPSESSPERNLTSVWSRPLTTDRAHDVQRRAKLGRHRLAFMQSLVVSVRKMWNAYASNFQNSSRVCLVGMTVPELRGNTVDCIRTLPLA